MVRRILLIFLMIAVIASTAALGAETLRGYSKADGGYQYVLLGSYPYEKDGTEAPVLWRILSADSGEMLLLTEYAIDTKQLTITDDPKVLKQHTYERLYDFADSDLCRWLNSEMLGIMFKDDQIINALLEKHQGKVSILNQEQLTNTSYGFEKVIYTNKKLASRLAYPTPYAISTGVYYDRQMGGTVGWWTSDFPKPKKAGIVGVNGHISNNFYTRKKVGVRPAVFLDMNRIEVASGTGTKDDPFILRYVPATSFRCDYLRLAEAGATDVAAFRFDTEQKDTEETVDEAEVLGDLESDLKQSVGKNELLLSFVGDISIDATQSRVSKICLTNIIRENGYAFPFSLLSRYLKTDDYTFANLEVVLTEREKLKSSKLYNMIAPPDFVNILTEGGIEAVNTVNNHCRDFGDQGYQDTLNNLDQAKVTHFGTMYPGMPQESDILGIADVKGIRIGMVGMSYPRQETNPEKNRDIKNFKRRIEKLKNEMGCQLVVCSLHWGHEGKKSRIPKLDGWQFIFARELIDAGADVVWGHHPHSLQPVYFYKGKPVMFSTGNFLFGLIANDIIPATGVFQLRYELKEGNPVLKEFSVVPCETGKRGDYRPFELEDDAARKTCWGYMTTKKPSYNMDNLPASFASSGRLLIAEDGTLLDAE